MIPPNVVELCQNGQSVSSELAKNPSLSPREAAKKLFGVDADDEISPQEADLVKGESADLEEARKCGKWGTSNPSDLFLRVRPAITCNQTYLTAWLDLP